MLEGTNYPYEATISYKSNWNEAAAWVVETHGLPGSKFLVSYGDKYMHFKFKSEEDCIWFTLKWS